MNPPQDDTMPVTIGLSPGSAVAPIGPILYMPIASPPTPAPSPGPHSATQNHIVLPPSAAALAHLSRIEFASLAQQSSVLRRQYLTSLLQDCTPAELQFVINTITSFLKRDFLRDLPTELALHVLDFIHEPRTLVRASQVSKAWQGLVKDESVWKRMSEEYMFYGVPDGITRQEVDEDEEPLAEMEEYSTLPMDPALQWLAEKKRQARREEKRRQPTSDPSSLDFSYRLHFRYSYITMQNWRHGGHLLRSHSFPVVHPDSGVVTSVALDSEWVVVGSANSKIHVFSARTGVLSRTLVGHESGVWSVCLIRRGRRCPSRVKVARTRGTSMTSTSSSFGKRMERLELNNGERDDAYLTPSLRYALGIDEGGEVYLCNSDDCCRNQMRPSEPCGASDGWGQPNTLIVSGGCDKMLKVWDVKSGYCIYSLPGHTSTIRCIKVLHNRPLAVTGSRDATLRVWDVQRGKMLKVLSGHASSVRCLDVWGSRAVSGSYDTTCRLWDLDNGSCIHVLRGHYAQIYSVAFDGIRIASGALDTTVRVWDAGTGHCIVVLTGHSALVCQLQISAPLLHCPGDGSTPHPILATGGSDGRIITFSLRNYSVLYRIAAHGSSVTSLQFDELFLVTGGNDGHIKIFDTATGQLVRDFYSTTGTIRQVSKESQTTDRVGFGKCDCVWKVVFGGSCRSTVGTVGDKGRDVCAIMGLKGGKTVMEIWSMRPRIVPQARK